MSLRSQQFWKKRENFFWFFLNLLWVVGWVFLTPQGVENLQPSSPSTEKRIVENEKALKVFIDHFEVAPLHLRDLLVFWEGYAREEYGTRFGYLALSEKDWLLRSFGRRGEQNTLLSSTDKVVSSFIENPIEGVEYLYSSSPHYFLPALLSGSMAPQGELVASVFQHRFLEKSTLLVRSRKDPSFVMTAPHDRVEEFLWLPGGKTIVYTASGSSRYSDGVYLWELKTGRTKNLLTRISENKSSLFKQERKKTLLSLAGIDANRGLLYFFYHSFAESLPPKEFFSRDSLRIFSLEKSSFLEKKESWSTPSFGKPLQEGLLLKCENGSILQKKLCLLPYLGDFGEGVEAWQSLSEKLSEDPSFSYTLWFLTLFYLDANRELSLVQRRVRLKGGALASSSQLTEVFAGYAKELAKGLSRHSLLPSWQRSLAMGVLESGLDKGRFKALPFLGLRVRH